MTARTNNGGDRRAMPWRIVGWGAAAGLVLLPLIAGAPWTVSDFALAAAMLGGAGLVLELVVRTTRNVAGRAAAGLALATALLLLWIDGAVGIIGSERNDVNLLYAGVLAVALLGAVAARFRPAGLARAMAAAALAQVAVPVIAATIDPAIAPLVRAPEVLGLTGIFAALWLVSAWLFAKAARTGAKL